MSKYYYERAVYISFVNRIGQVHTRTLYDAKSCLDTTDWYRTAQRISKEKKGDVFLFIDCEWCGHFYAMYNCGNELSRKKIYHVHREPNDISEGKELVAYGGHDVFLLSHLIVPLNLKISSLHDIYLMWDMEDELQDDSYIAYHNDSATVVTHLLTKFLLSIKPEYHEQTKLLLKSEDGSRLLWTLLPTMKL